MAEQNFENLLSRSGRQVFLGDLERRRPTKRMTTVRSFAVVRNWASHPNGEKSDEPASPSSQKHTNQSPDLSHQPLGFQDVQPMSDDDNADIHIPSIPDDDDDGNVDLSPLVASNKKELDGESSSDITQNASVAQDDVSSIAVDESPTKDELPQSFGVDGSLPGGEETVSKIVVQSNSETPLLNTGKEQDFDEEDENDDNPFAGDDVDIYEEKKSPENEQSPSSSIGLKSGQQSLQSRPTAKKRVVLDIKTRKNKQPRFDEEEYEAQNFVRLYNADRGRKGGSKEVTDLDIVLTNVEEIALDMRRQANSPLTKKVVREAFIQLRQIFSDTIDIYKEKKYLQSATTKTNSRLQKTRQELVKIQDQRKETETELNRLKSECDTLEKQIKCKKEAFDFLHEFGNFQDDLRKSDKSHNKTECCANDDLPTLLCEASGYLSTERQLRNINNKLQSWLDNNNK